MAKVTITLVDQDDGGISINYDFDPSADPKVPPTYAQHAALLLMDKLSEALSDEQKG